MAIESSFQDMLLKVVLFVVVQALVYLILSGSSNIFSKSKPRPNSFRPVRSVSVRRMLAVLADMPAGGEPSPSPKDLKKQSQPDPADCTSTS